MERQGVATPFDKKERVELWPGLSLYLDAFFDLDSERTHGETISPIPASAVRQYAVDYGFSEDQFNRLRLYIRKMDQAHMKWLGARMEKKIRDAQRPTKSGKPTGRVNRPVNRGR